MTKRILMLGGSRLQVPAIQYARQQGHYVITCDYLPSNPGHRFANEYHNVSTTDLVAVLSLARHLRVDGVVAYASDPAAPTAAYVCNALGLPSNPFESVLILTRKDLFRKFLAANEFNTPKWEAFLGPAEARLAGDRFRFPIVVKPVDSSGSKGVTVVHHPDGIEPAFERAFSFARHKSVVVEEFIEVEDEAIQLEGDGFVCKGRLAFRCFGNGHFDLMCNPVVPIGASFPSVFGEEIQERAHADIQRALDLLHMERGALNFDIRVDRYGRIFLLEIGPRNGGNLLPQVIKRVTGVDLIDYTLRSALGMDCSDLRMEPIVGTQSVYVLHAQKDGVFEGITFSDEIQTRIRARDIWPVRGQPVQRFEGSDRALGYLILEFESREQMLDDMKHMERHVTVLLQ